MTHELPHMRGISWLTIVLAALAVITFIMASGGTLQQPIPYGVMSTITSRSVPPSAGMMEGGGTPGMAPSTIQDSAGKMMAPDYYPYPGPQYGQAPATDTREFLKVNYSATMRTRDVQGLTRRVETTVRGYDGRVDQESSSPEYGYVSFVVPISKYDAFRTELEGLVGSRFLTVNISSQNLLPQKQSIEEQQKQADTALADYKAARQKLVNAHASTVQSLQSRIDADTQELATLRAQTQTPQILIQIQTVSSDLSSLKAQLANENASYSVQLSNADASIKYAQDWQTAVKTQDQALLDNVATVSGTVSLQWISLWEMARLYLPGYWIPFIFAVLAFLSYLWDRRRFRAL